MIVTENQYHRIKKIQEDINLLLTELEFIKKDVISIDEVVTQSANYFKINKREILKNSRKKRLVEIRRFIYTYLRDVNGNTYQSIASYFGRHHASIIHSYNNFRDDLTNYVDVKQEYNQYLQQMEF